MEMHNSTVNFTTSDISTNSTSDSFDLISRMFVSSLSVLLGFPTHSYVIWLIIEGGFSSEFFNLNLSVCEIGICLKSLMNLLSFWYSSFKTVSNILQGLAITGRPLFQSLICVERYLAVVHPVIFLKYKPLRYRLICCTAAWIITLGSCFICLLSVIFTWGIYTSWYLLQFLFFLSIQFFCLMAVLRVLKRSGPGDRRREEENNVKKRACYLILITTVSMAIIYVPYAILGFITILTKMHIPALWFTSLFCYTLAGFVPPVLFLYRVGKLPPYFIKSVKS